MVEMSLITSGLLRAYRQAGYEPALDLAQKLNTFYRKTFFTPDGAFLTTQTGSIKSHVHGHARGLHAMADLGLITDDRGLLDFVIQSYEWTKSSVETLTGFTPNIVPSPRWTEPAIPGEIDPGTSPSFVNMDEFNGCEIMGLADMIGVALWLSTRVHKYGDVCCWSLASRYGALSAATLASREDFSNTPTRGERCVLVPFVIVFPNGST